MHPHNYNPYLGGDSGCFELYIDYRLISSLKIVHVHNYNPYLGGDSGCFELYIG